MTVEEWEAAVNDLRAELLDMIEDLRRDIEDLMMGVEG